MTRVSVEGVRRSPQQTHKATDLYMNGQVIMNRDSFMNCQFARIVATAILFSVLFCSVEGRAQRSERYLPKLLDYRLDEIPFDFHEMIGALAPRFCFLIAPLGDTNFRWQSVDRVAQAARAVYHLYRVPDRLRVAHPNCAHDFSPAVREEAYQLLDSVLRR